METAQPWLEIFMGHDGRVRINVPARNAGELSRIIITTVRKNTVEVVLQEQKTDCDRASWL